jgi:flavorubredoxin
LTDSPHRPAAPSGPSRPLPRQIAEGVDWLGGCLEQPYKGRILHGYNSAYLVSGRRWSLLVESGLPKDVSLVEDQLAELFAAGRPPLRHILVTHCETPHAGGVGRLLDRFPDAVAVGGVHDLHLAFPDQADRIMLVDDGTSIDLGGRTVTVLPAAIRDLVNTQWAFDSGARVLFPGDGFAYSHYHEDGHCGKTAEESPNLDIPDMTALFAELALHWTTLCDIELYIARLDGMLDDLAVETVAPTHGLPITDLGATVPLVRQGLRLGAGAVVEEARR